MAKPPNTIQHPVPVPQKVLEINSGDFSRSDAFFFAAAQGITPLLFLRRMHLTHLDIQHVGQTIGVLSPGHMVGRGGVGTADRYCQTMWWSTFIKKRETLEALHSKEFKGNIVFSKAKLVSMASSCFHFGSMVD